MRKELKFSARIDTQEFDRTVDQLQRKIKEIYRGSESSRTQFENQQRLGSAGLGKPLTPQDRIRQDAQEVRSRQEIDKFIKQQIKDQEKLNQTINKQLDSERELKKLRDAAKGDKIKEVELTEKLARVQDDIARNRGKSQGIDQGISDALNRREEVQRKLADPNRILRGYQAGGIGGAWGQAKGVLGAMGPGAMAGLMGSAVGALGLGIGMAGETAANYMMMPQQTLSNYGNAAQFQNQRIQNAFAGRNYQNLIYAQEMRKAKQMGDTAVTAQKTRDITGSIGNIMMSAGAGAGLGAAGGAFVGGVGAVPGAIIGGTLGLGKGIYQEGGRLLGMAGVGRWGDEYKSNLERQRATSTQEAFEQQKNLNIFKKSAVEDFDRNMMPNLQMQRALGFSDQDMFGRYNQGTGAGFTRDQTRDAMMGILGSGGSTRAARDLSGFSMGLQRDYDMTNAPQLLGRLSGTIGGSQATQESMIKIMAEGIRQGLDKSEFREENRRFSQVIADAAYGAGAKTEGGVADIAAFRGAFMTDQSMKGIEVAGSTAEYVKGLQGQTGGLRAAIEAGYMFGDKDLSKLNTDQMLSLQSMSSEDLAAMSPERKKMLMEQTGLSEEDFRKKTDKMKFTKAVGPNIDLIPAIEKYKELSGKVGPLTEEEQSELSKVNKQIEFSGARMNLNAKQQESFANYLRKGEMGRAADIITSGTGGQTGRVGDAINADAARMDNLMNALQEKLVPGLHEAADASKDLAAAFRKAQAEMERARSPEERFQIGKTLDDLMSRLMPQDASQNQSAPPAGK